MSGQPHDASYSAEMERLDNTEAAALEKLCQDLSVAEAKDEDAEDEESRRLMTEVATVDIKEETSKLVAATQARLQKVEAQYEALKVVSALAYSYLTSSLTPPTYPHFHHSLPHLLIHPLNTPSQLILSTIPLSTPSKHLSTPPHLPPHLPPLQHAFSRP